MIKKNVKSRQQHNGAYDNNDGDGDGDEDDAISREYVREDESCT